jgi:hypothetical protein
MYTEPKTDSLDQLSLEQAQALKKETKARKDNSNRNLELLMRSYETQAREAYYAHLQGVDLAVAKFKELIGRGREYQYQKHLQALGEMSGDLTTMAENTKQLTVEYKSKMQQTRIAMYEDRRLFELNSVIYNEKQKALHRSRDELEQLESQSVLGTVSTTEAMSLHKRILDLESDIIDINFENDELAVQLTTTRGILESQRQTYSGLQDLHGNIQRQKSVFNAHYELAQAQERVVKNVQGAQSARDIYMRSAVLVQKLKELQDGLSRKGIESVPPEFTLSEPQVHTTRDPTRPYWMTVSEQIRKTGYGV